MNSNTSPDTVAHVAQVVGAHAAAWTVAISNVSEMLGAISFLLASAFTVYKFVMDRIDRRKRK